ncbi:helicase domain protein [Methanosalsum zhilinae DSM 4017]|uniref:Helicase domain protein n=1 Tax=Methanosalsum zhilinae (strain DSM 4017 / NBRC 107636 / OCM 62 / WeN5) TaxID=679901 RepID=F7XN38_METZD|nr:helicase-related protein [Methanosalsum zhilinae]AEH61152.1 helicase domain protein [Methanosalsum zhilinae DSM 4017]
MIKEWQYSTIHNSPCKVIEEQNLWGNIVYRIWLPNQDTVVRVPQSALRPLTAEIQPEIEANRITYVAAAAKVAEVLEGGSHDSDGPVLLAPMESNVIPLPHQIRVLSRAVSGDKVRYLLADEVGLGKTIEAGLIMRELKLRGLVRRILVVAPKGLATQWVSEMHTHFNEDFQLVFGEDLATIKRIISGNHSRYWAQGTKLRFLDEPDELQHANPWRMFDQVIVSLDSVKPMDKRRGWSQERIDEYNRSRFEDLITAGWDMVVVDESHRLGGSTDQVARYKLGRGLAEAAPYLLLLSATPHQGKSDAFHRLMSLLDDKTFPDMDSVTRERVAAYVIRTEKRRAVDGDGNPLFKPRVTKMAPVTWEERHRSQQMLYEEVTKYVREGYNQALREKKQHIGFLMILMQRLVVSSTRAIRTTLERRLEVLKDIEIRTSQRLEEITDSGDEVDELYEMDGQELLDELLKSRISAMQNERIQVENLLETAYQCEQQAPDAKAESLIEWIYQLQAEENEADLKLLIFTEFVPTQQMLKEFLEARGISVVTLNGFMDMDERKKAQDDFCDKVRVLISTDAGGEGLNLQFCHVVINYDIPWNPMRLEQRIGRVDRIGQAKVVRAINFLFQESIEFRVREVLEQKLSIILNEFGIDKTGDVLDSAQAGELFEGIFASAILDPDNVEASVDNTVSKIREEIHEIRESSPIFGISEEPDLQTADRLRSHPLPYWVERMTVGYIKSHGGHAIRKRESWDLMWPDSKVPMNCTFNSHRSQLKDDVVLLNLEDNKIRGLALNLPMIASGQPIPCVSIDELSSKISGFWGLFEIRIVSGTYNSNHTMTIPQIRRRYLSVFVSDEGNIFLPTARHIWDIMQTAELKILHSLDHKASIDAYDKVTNAAESAGQALFNTLKQEHSSAIEHEEIRGHHAFEARRKAIGRLGLPEVRQYRLDKCISEENVWKKELEIAKETVPDIKPLLLMQIQRRD